MNSAWANLWPKLGAMAWPNNHNGPASPCHGVWCKRAPGAITALRVARQPPMRRLLRRGESSGLRETCRTWRRERGQLSEARRRAAEELTDGGAFAVDSDEGTD
jgi:hypothetical protein